MRVAFQIVEQQPRLERGNPAGLLLVTPAVPDIFGRFILGQDQPPFVQPQPGCLLVIPPQPGEFPVDFAQARPALGGVGCLVEQGLGEPHELHGEAAGEAVGEFLTMGGLGQIIALLGEAINEAPGFLMPEPVLVAASAPFGEVLLGDGAAAKVFGEGLLHTLQAIEPVDEVNGRVALFEAVAEDFADNFGQPGNFTSTRMMHRNSGFRLILPWFGKKSRFSETEKAKLRFFAVCWGNVYLQLII